jgi:hypothetical protein
VVPALKVTRGVGTRLKQATAGGGGLKFGGVWTFVIVAQVAVTVAFPVAALLVRRDAVKLETIDVGFPVKEFLSVRLEMDREAAPGVRVDTSRAAFRTHFRSTYQELARRVAADPAVAEIAFADRLPLMYHPHRIIEVDDGGAAPRDPRWPNGYRVSSASIDQQFLDAVDAPVILGRGFRESDARPGVAAPDARDAPGGVVIVNQLFVRRVFGDRNPIGRRLRYVYFEGEDRRVAAEKKPGPWYEIVGVVRDVGMAAGADVGQAEGGDPKGSGIYHPVVPGGIYPAHMAVHVRGDPAAFVPRLRALATVTDPSLRLYNLTPLDRVLDAELEFLSFWFRMLLLVSALALVLSLAGIYAVMSFTVARRTREIGVRIALGADRRRVVTAIFKRPIRQVALGVLAGGGIVAFLTRAVMGAHTVSQAGLVVAYGAVMMLVCLTACIVPTLRALRIEPTEALREEA